MDELIHWPKPDRISGGYLADIWRISGWYLADIWRISGRVLWLFGIYVLLLCDPKPEPLNGGYPVGFSGLLSELNTKCFIIFSCWNKKQKSTSIIFLHISEVSFFVGVAASKTPFVFIDDLFITGEKLEGSLKNNCRPTFSNFFA